MESEKTDKIRVLFRSWIQIAHSYAIVNCFQLIHLYKLYSDKIEFYVEEMPYFRQEWNNSKKLVYNEEYNNIIKNFKKWSGETVDLIYSITYPYNITVDKINNKVIPKCVFYTSEFATLDKNYFSCDKQLIDDNFIKQYWKLLLAIAYAMFIPLYFYQSAKSIQNSLDSSRESSEKQINILQNSLDEQSLYYDMLLQEYQDRMDAEDVRYNEELNSIKQAQEQQQKELSKRFKNNPSTISDELKRRYKLNDK